MKRFLITGGAGFIGSNLVRFLQNMGNQQGIENHITVLDALTYAGNRKNLESIPNRHNLDFIEGNVCDSNLVANLVKGVDCIFHLAAETHVDNSITSSKIFMETNILGSWTILEAARIFEKRIILVSTDEVYGSLKSGYATEEFNLDPSSPYSASKASSDLLAKSMFKTFGSDIIITRCSNNYGKRQNKEKLIPLAISRIINNENVPVYGNGLNIRDWIHVDDHCLGIYLAYEKGVSGEIYNLGDVDKITNLELVQYILDIMSNSKSKIEFVEDRLGHDARYALDSSKAKRDLSWIPIHRLVSSLPETIDWYVNDFKSRKS